MIKQCYRITWNSPNKGKGRISSLQKFKTQKQARKLINNTLTIENYTTGGNGIYRYNFKIKGDKC